MITWYIAAVFLSGVGMGFLLFVLMALAIRPDDDMLERMREDVERHRGGRR